MVVSCLFRLLVDFVNDHKFLPKILHVHADNCGRENKNMFVFSFLYCLVQLNIVEEVIVSFLLVGHTGNAMDQVKQ